MKEFVAHPLVKGGQMQTIIGHFSNPLKKVRNTKTQFFQLDENDRTILQRNIPDSIKADSPIIVTLHGLGGSSESAYNIRITQKLNNLGYEVLRFNHRGCGPNARKLAKEIFHAGQIDDIYKTLELLKNEDPNRGVLLVGFSLSANALLMMLGKKEFAQTLPSVSGALAICPPVDLWKCSNALGEKGNGYLDYYYTKKLIDTIDERAASFEELEEISWPPKMNLKKFDEIFTAPQAGFSSLDEYYTTCSSKYYLKTITTPTVILAANDDPIVPTDSFEDVEYGSSVKLEITKGGGHMGFLSHKKTRFGDKRWMDEVICDWVEAQ
jgi:uncharacterized protein